MRATTAREIRPGRSRARAIALAVVAAALLLLGVGRTASAHVLPTSSVQLTVGADVVRAVVSIPASDLEAASGIDLGDESTAAVQAQAAAIDAYLVAHVQPTSDDGQAWSVSAATPTVSGAGDAATTGLYREVHVLLTLAPPVGSSAADVRAFNLGYTAVVDKVATHTVIVTVASDWATGHVDAPYEVWTVQRSTVTNTVVPLHVDLGAGSNLRGLTSMVRLGVAHIAEGTDHQLFLLTLLLPAPLLAVGRRWRGPVPARQAVRRILTITASFTLGHSVTLALGALGVPVPQQLVETLIAVSILVAAAHAIRPLFPGREAVVAASFGLIHGLAFSQTLRALDLRGARLVLSLLGFNLGIELMQLVVVVAVLPPLVLLARAGRYQTLRVVAASVTGVAAVGWVVARLGAGNPVADLADRLGTVGLPVVAVLWVVALILTYRVRRAQPAELSVAERAPEGEAVRV